MIFTRNLYVIVEGSWDTEIWKGAVFTDEEVDEYLEVAKQETGRNHVKRELDEHFRELSYIHY